MLWLVLVASWEPVEPPSQSDSTVLVTPVAVRVVVPRLRHQSLTEQSSGGCAFYHQPNSRKNALSIIINSLSSLYLIRHQMQMMDLTGVKGPNPYLLQYK